jgi:hypothetical protein
VQEGGFGDDEEDICGGLVDGGARGEEKEQEMDEGKVIDGQRTYILSASLPEWEDNRWAIPPEASEALMRMLRACDKDRSQNKLRKSVSFLLVG